MKACFEEYLRKKKGLPKEELAQNVTTDAKKANNSVISSSSTIVAKPNTTRELKPSENNKPTTNAPAKPATNKPVVKPAALVQPSKPSNKPQTLSQTGLGGTR